MIMHHSRWEYMLQSCKRLGTCKQMKGTGHADGRLKNRTERASEKIEIELC